MKRPTELLAAAALGGALFFAAPGCSTSLDIPQDAQLMSEGTGTVAARAPHSGTVYVVDTSDNKIDYKGDVARDQLITVDADSGKITSEGTTLSDKISSGHRHKILFERNDHIVTHRETVETRTTEVPATAVPHRETVETRTTEVR